MKTNVFHPNFEDRSLRYINRRRNKHISDLTEKAFLLVVVFGLVFVTLYIGIGQ